MKNYKLALLSLFVVMLILFTVGCDKTEKPGTDTETQDVQVTDSETEETKAEESDSEEETTTTEPEKKEGFSEEASASLNSFRQSIVGTPQMFGVAYLGYEENIDKSELSKYIAERFPNLFEDLPFVGEIEEKFILGGEMGDVFLIVPLDAENYVTVSRCMYTGNDEWHYDDKIYSSESGDPFIIICNGSGYEPDTEVIIANKSGNGVTWYPQLSDNGRTRTDSGNCSADVLKDFSPYSEILWREYSDMKDDKWKLPSKENLVGTVWYGEDYMEDGNVYWYEISFFDGYANVRWNNDGEDHEYSGASWALTYDEGVALIEFDFGQFEGLKRCAVLITTEENLFYTCADIVGGEDNLCGGNRSCRTLERQYG